LQVLPWPYNRTRNFCDSEGLPASFFWYNSVSSECMEVSFGLFLRLYRGHFLLKADPICQILPESPSACSISASEFSALVGSLRFNLVNPAFFDPSLSNSVTH